MKILRNMLGILLLLTVLCSCHRLRRTVADYREHPFRAEIRFISGGVTVYAEMETVLVDGALTPSSMRLLAPPSLEGIVLEREGEEIVLTRDGLRTPCAGAKGWWETADLLCASGTMHYVCDTELEGLPLAYMEIGEGRDAYGIFCERETGSPKKIVRGAQELTLIRFERIEARAS